MCAENTYLPSGYSLVSESADRILFSMTSPSGVRLPRPCRRRGDVGVAVRELAVRPALAVTLHEAKAELPGRDRRINSFRIRAFQGDSHQCSAAACPVRSGSVCGSGKLKTDWGLRFGNELIEPPWFRKFKNDWGLRFGN